MESVSIVTQTPKSSIENLYSVLSICLEKRYKFYTDDYFDGFDMPNINIEENNAVSSSEDWPLIMCSISEDKYIYAEDDVSPLKHETGSYYYILGFRCRDEMFLLEFLLDLLRKNDDFYVVNSILTLLSREKLEECCKNKYHNWMFLE